MATEAKDKFKGATDAHTDKGAEEAAAGSQSQPASDPNQDKTAGSPKAGLPQPDDKGKGGAKGSEKAQADPPKNDPPPAKKEVTHVRVISEGTLGPQLLVKGDVTDDPDYVAILKQKGQKKVEAVK
jgi:hypothetical protein